MVADEIPADVREEVLRRLRDVERDEDVQILFAIESGSRAWGFASANSDFDVRFVYRHRKPWYLSVDERRDVIERPIIDDIDLNGWDVRKALQLPRKTNPALIEWLHSPIVYCEAGEFIQEMRALIPGCFSAERAYHHYFSMARTNFREHLRGDTVPLKKYFYVLRPLFAVRWLESHRTAPPIEFERLLPVVADREDLLMEIRRLLDRKRAATEKEYIPRRAVLNDFIEAELERLAAHAAFPDTRDNCIDSLNDFFRTTLDTPWPGAPTA